MKKKLKLLFSIFWTFFKIGAFTFGGGYAMIPLIQRETVENKKWISEDDILEIVAIAESTPGPIAINSSTFVGYRTAGVLGALFGTVGMVLPSFTIILFLSFVLTEFKSIKAVEYAFMGIRAGVLALVLKALITMFKKVKKDLVSCFIMVAAFVAVAIFSVNVLYVIIGCAVVGLTSSMIMARRAKKQ